MKKTILFSILLLPLMAYSQIPVWVNSFDTPDDVLGWTFYNGNGNSNQWQQGNNIYLNGTTLSYGTAGVLRYSISLVPSGTAANFASENDWVISPEIDLTGASGTITLAAYISRQRSSHTIVGRDLWIFTSTPQKPVPTVADFQAMTVDVNGNTTSSPYTIIAGNTANPWPSTDVTQSAESLVNLSSFAGKKIYIGFWSNRITAGLNVQNINIDEIGIYATSFVLGTKESAAQKALTKVMENPVSESLQLQLNPIFKENSVMVTIYNMAGQKVLMSKYSRNINVTALSTGTYLAEVSDGKTAERLKFIKK
ncbi:T9SS type A sorting domain-containing protein [Chryseobacterium salviniae]|uniref:T9SS type A sorting domain-containing protein n=1 Tax=Chryseobacterium salviniae TaxID=3101750 RepID=A0ABU6HMX9_9FLAO|nr:T9SS type A sorting domain-containing protein [Chryseobacterium sp. T9W2-O]MEC3874416.1 T9SS type A sorting domain-containing protein [Chryseobacterium sp. T9W2-O]